MRKRFVMLAATALVAISSPALATEASTTTTTEAVPAGEAAVTTTTTETTPSGEAAVTTTTIIPTTAPAAVVADPTPPRDAITGEPVTPEAEKVEEEEDKSLRDKVRDKMKNKAD